MIYIYMLHIYMIYIYTCYIYVYVIYICYVYMCTLRLWILFHGYIRLIIDTWNFFLRTWKATHMVITLIWDPRHQELIEARSHRQCVTTSLAVKEAGAAALNWMRWPMVLWKRAASQPAKFGCGIEWNLLGWFLRTFSKFMMPGRQMQKECKLRTETLMDVKNLFCLLQSWLIWLYLEALSFDPGMCFLDSLSPISQNAARVSQVSRRSTVRRSHGKEDNHQEGRKHQGTPGRGAQAPNGGFHKWGIPKMNEL